MANSTIIPKLKAAVMHEIINDENLFYAIDSPDVTDISNANELLYRHVFPYHRHSEALTTSGTFLTIQVHIPKTYDSSNIWVVPTLEIWILSHSDHMKIDGISNISDNRNDYISRLLDKKFNGRDTLNAGENADHLHLYGKMHLVSNTEGVFSRDFLYRQMIFEMKDLNNSLCDDEQGIAGYDE